MTCVQSERAGGVCVCSAGGCARACVCEGHVCPQHDASVCSWLRHLYGLDPTEPLLGVPENVPCG